MTPEYEPNKYTMALLFGQQTERLVEQASDEYGAELRSAILVPHVLERVAASFGRKLAECQKHDSYRYSTLIFKTGLGAPLPEAAIIEVGVTPTLARFEEVYRDVSDSYEEYIRNAFVLLPEKAYETIPEEIEDVLYGHALSFMDRPITLATFKRVGSLSYELFCHDFGQMAVN